MKKTAILYLCIMLVCPAAQAWESWANGWVGADGNWFNLANWSAARVPDYDDSLNYTTGFVTQIAGNSNGPIILSGQNASFYKIQIGTTASASPGKLTVQSGGGLTGKEYMLLANDANTFGICENNGGIITVNTYLTVGGSGVSIFNMNGGQLNIATTLSVPSSSAGKGTFYLNAGLVNVGSAGSGVNIGPGGIFNISSGTLDIDDRIRIWGSGGQINITGGTIYANEIDLVYGTITIASGGQIVIDGNVVSLMQGYIDGDKIVLANSTDSEFVLSCNGTSTTLAVVDSGYDLWSGGQIPTLEEISYPDGIRHIKVHKAIAGEYQFLHGAGIINHKGVFYAGWANSPVNENSIDECVRGRRSYDGGITWGPIEMVAPPIAGDDAHSHGVYFSLGGKLWYFAAHYRTPSTQTDAYMLDEPNNIWRFKGVPASAFHPFDEPKQMGNGKWIIGGDTSVPKVAIFSETAISSWTVKSIPLPSGMSLLYPETSLWVDDDKITAIIRNSTENKALISFSYDYGMTWTTAAETDFPMAASKPYCGRLSTGQRYLVFNPDPSRDTLAIAVSSPCEKQLCTVWKIRQGVSPQPLYPGSAKTPQWSYPYAVEYDGNLYVVYSAGKEDCDMSVIPIESLYLMPSMPSDINNDCKVNLLDLAQIGINWLEYVN